MGTIWQDLRYALRMLRKSKGFTATALLTLAICIGVNSAMFSMLYSLVIHPLPYPESERIVRVYNSFPKLGIYRVPGNIAQYLDYKAHASAFSYLAAWSYLPATVSSSEGADRALGMSATAEIFDVLAVKPVLGRFFLLENNRPANNRVIVLTHSFWRSAFHANPSILGHGIQVDRISYEIIGVAPRSFEALDAEVRFVLPMTWTPEMVTPAMRSPIGQYIFGRLKPRATVADANAQIAALEEQYNNAEAPPGVKEFRNNSGHTVGVAAETNMRGMRSLRGDKGVGDLLYLLQGIVILVLLIGCANITNLLLARLSARHAELATRMALGAGYGKISRQLLFEIVLLAFLGTMIGIFLGSGALTMANHFSSHLWPYALPFEMNHCSLVYTVMIASCAGLVMGAIIVFHVRHGNLLGWLLYQGRTVSGGRRIRATSNLLVILQIAVTMILLVGAGLLIRSFSNALAVDPALNPKHLIAARMALPIEYRRDNQSLIFQQQLDRALHEIPGLTSIAFASATPFQGELPLLTFSKRNKDLSKEGSQPFAYFIAAGPSYRDSLKIPLIQGRWFKAGDDRASLPVVVVDRNFARRYFANENAIGRCIAIDREYEIVGVVGNVPHRGVDGIEGGAPFAYFPLQQSNLGISEISIFIRSNRSVSEVIAQLREKVKEIDPAIPVYQANSMEGILRENHNPRRAIMFMLVCFAGMAMLLSAIGIYGVLTYAVTQRTREIGIRSAIGATRRQVLTLILKQGIWRVLIGLGLGIIGAVFLSSLMANLLFEVSPKDSLTYLSMSAVLLLVALMASLIPAWRAAHVDPTATLRFQ